MLCNNGEFIMLQYTLHLKLKYRYMNSMLPVAFSLTHLKT